MSERDTTYFETAFARHCTLSTQSAATLQELIRASKLGALSIEKPEGYRIPLHAPVDEHQGRLYLKRNLIMARETAQRMARHSKAQMPAIKPIHTNAALYPSQEKALQLALTSPLMLLSGGPGSGKSYTARAIIEEEIRQNPNSHIITTAPTGKALSLTSHPKAKSKTLHALLGVREHDRLDKQPKPILADLIIVDEGSMIELPLWYKLFKALSLKTRIVLMGDPDQLPPIEGWGLFSSLLASNTLPHIHLDQLKRSDSLTLSHLFKAVREGKEKESLTYMLDKSLPEVSLKPLPDPRLVSYHENGVYLCPFKHGPYGTDAINASCAKEKQSQKAYPIMVTKNDYHLFLMNGEIGSLEGNMATFAGKESPIPKELLPPYDIAWAISIHKSQGSEFAHAHIMLPEESLCFDGKLLYTAITRAKESVTIYAAEETVEKLIQKMQLQQRIEPLINDYL